jgi:hypothetical protein
MQVLTSPAAIWAVNDIISLLTVEKKDNVHAQYTKMKGVRGLHHPTYLSHRIG